jgi:hypothetical protein
MRQARYLARYSIAMNKLLDYNRKQDDEFVGIHPQPYPYCPRNGGEHSKYLHRIQHNIAWVLQKIAELEKLQDYNIFRPSQLEAFLTSDNVKERCGMPEAKGRELHLFFKTPAHVIKQAT